MMLMTPAVLEPLDETVDHVRGAAGRVILESRDMSSGIASEQVLGTPTLFIDGVVHTGALDADTLIDALTHD
jgi:hypothetical protein